MLSLIKSILPQALILVGIAGMAVIILRGARRTPQFWESVMEAAERFKARSSKKALLVTEKTLRLAKIIALRLDNFFSKKLEILIKKRNQDILRRDFWKKMRSRRAMIKRPVKNGTAMIPPDAIFRSETRSEPEPKEDTLARFAKEKQNGAQAP